VQLDDDTNARATPTDDLDQGGAELVSALIEGMQIQMEIQIGVGVLMAKYELSEEEAYVRLREKAAATGLSLLEAADSLKERAIDRGRGPNENRAATTQEDLPG
jgi:AmiR/NasT family two-component response regulator